MNQFSSQNQVVVSRHSLNIRQKMNPFFIFFLILGCLVFIGSGAIVSSVMAAENTQFDEQTLLTTVQEYAQAVAQGDIIQAGQRDFVCLYQMKLGKLALEGQFADPTAPIYEWCSQRRVEAHERAIAQRDRALDAVWPGKGKLVDFADFQRFFIAETGSRELAPSFFVMRQIAVIEPTNPFTIELVKTSPLPHASFRFEDYDPVQATPTTMVTVQINYPNPNTAPVSNASGTEDWVVPYKKRRGVVKSVKVNWVVLSDLKKLGFPTDHAVLDMPLEGEFGTTIPFVIESGGFAPHSTEWWGPGEDPEALQAAVEQAQASSDSYEAIMILNRVLIIEPQHQGALDALSQQLYKGMLAYGERIHGVHLEQEELARRFNELYWTVISQTDRFDLSVHMEMGGKPEPMPADYLYRMIPVMEAIASLQPGDFENRLRLGIAYRWVNDQLAAINTPQILLTEIPPEQTDLHSRVLLELAWSRIGKVAWNRHFDDPDILKGYEEAERAFNMTQNHLDKFSAAYAMAYSLAFRVEHDKKAMLDLLKEARGYFEQLPGATPEAWAYLLQNDTLKGFVDTDPSFKALLAANIP
ncbi:MAG: hypothetical protein JSU59_06000 [Nitrospirota bacterium]|nr:MAG: hypothetical protein JSU59_06000 [Nitrospirota bacterium]